MSVDDATVRRIAHLARIAVKDDEIAHLRGEINGILGWIEQLGEVNVDNVEPMTSVTPVKLKMRKDEVTDGGYPERVLANAPNADGGYFLVPKIIE
jgi:aspartyl-tRNA(Asn)/glutamyl-tRNA(Gln) amidotransferase subunit C